MARRRRSGGPIQRTRDGQYELLISSDERTVFLDLLNQFESVVADPTNPAVRRLFPTAYVDDARGTMEQEGLGGQFIEVVLRPGQSAAEGQAIATRLMHRLGIAPKELVDKAYADMLAESSTGA